MAAERGRTATKQPSVEDDVQEPDTASRQTLLRADSGPGSSTALERKSSAASLRKQPTLPRRRSSNVSDFSTRSITTDSLLLPRPTPKKAEDASNWHSVPLAFAILPAVGGLFFKDGSVFITDIFLLGLGGLFLNWFVRMPWEWYESAQATVTIKPETGRAPDTIIEESDEDEIAVLSDSETAGKVTKGKHATDDRETHDITYDTKARDDAAAQLRRMESLALLACFAGPLLGAYMLHAIRGQLTRPSEGLVSNFNLTIFVLAAEIRPCSHLITLIQARTLHLQRVVETNTSDIDRVQSEQITEAQRRIDDLEAAIAERNVEDKSKVSQEGSVQEVNQAVRQSVQPQLDALNRAVRRYEKRAMTQTIQTEARLQDLEARLRDALSLAAIAADRSQKPGIILSTLEGASTLFLLPLQAVWTVLAWPAVVGTNILASGKVWLLGGRIPRPQPRQRRSKESQEHFKAGGQRPLSKMGRR